MYQFKLKDENGEKYKMKGTDLRIVLTVHHMQVGTEIVWAERGEKV